MYRFTVPDMTCGHCVGTITRALRDLDPKAKIDISLADRRVQVDSGLPQADIARQISEAGYTPRLES